MQDVLMNLAKIHLMQYCEENNINTSNSFIARNKVSGRGFFYSLHDYTTGKVFATVEFTKGSLPNFSYQHASYERGKEGK